MFGANTRKIKIVMLVGFLTSVHLALVSYINSSFLSNFLSEPGVGWLYTIASVASVLAFLYIPKVLSKIRGYKFLLFTFALSAISLFLLAGLQKTAPVVFWFLVYFVLNNVLVFLLDDVLQLFSEDGTTGKLRGFYLTMVNLAWVLAQAFYGAFLGASRFGLLYFISGAIMLLCFLIVYFYFQKLPEPKYDTVAPLSAVRKFFRMGNLKRSYKIYFLLQFFYAWMIIYTPIYLYNYLHFSWSEIGFIFTIMLVPFVLIEMPLGKYSDRVGERQLLMFGFALMSVSTVLLFFLKEHALWLWAAGLFATRCGAAVVEVMSDSYFFKHITAANDEFIGVYRNAGPLAYVFAPLAALLIFASTPSFNYLFLILGILMLYGIYLASTIRRGDI